LQKEMAHYSEGHLRLFTDPIHRAFGDGDTLLLPLLAKSGLAHLLIAKRLRALPHGVVHVRLTA